MTFLTAAQLKRMHETEGAYFLNELTQLDLHVGSSLEAFRCAVLPLSPNMRSPTRKLVSCVWETLALMGVRHLISPRWLEEM